MYVYLTINIVDNIFNYVIEMAIESLIDFASRMHC